MEEQDHSYLDLSVLPELRSNILSSNAVVLFGKSLENILWANATGARLFGGQGVADLLAMKLSDKQSVIHQLKNSVSRLKPGKTIVRGFRVSRGSRSILMQFEITRIKLPNDDHGYMVTNFSDEDTKTDETAIANKAVKALDNFADASAILDESATPLAMSPRFVDLSPTSENLEELAEELGQEKDRLIKRVTYSESGEAIAAGLARIGDNPGRILIVLARTAGEQEDESPAADPDTDSYKKSETPYIEEETADMVTPAPEPNTAQEFIPEPVSGESVDRNSRQTDARYSRTLNPSHEHAGKNDIRFSWSVDENAVFQSASDELKQTVGARASDIIGKSWNEVSATLAFDNDREIAKRLEKQDTWSGRTVFWPVDNTDMCIPVDLAALPVFGSDRQFEGFKGFGIIRQMDAVVDPHARGLSISSPSSFGDSQENEHDSDDFKEIPDIYDNQARTQDQENDLDQQDSHFLDAPNQDANEKLADDDTNVVRLVPKEFEPVAQPLSDKESSAFEVIGQTLRSRNETAKNYSAGKKDQRHLDTSLMENLPVAILVYKTDELLFANQKFFEESGYVSLKELEVAGGLDSILNPGAESDNKNDGKQYLSKKNGNQISIEPVLHTVPWLGETALLLSFPVTQDVIIEEPLALEISTSSEIQNILDTASDGIILMEPDGTIVSINASAEALFGEEYDDATGKKLHELFADESRDTIVEYLDSLSSPGVERLLNDGRDVIGKEKKGGLIPIFLTLSKMESSNKICAVVRDMTSWKKVEEELIQSRREALKASEQKSDFLAHVSHEIRTPLNAIIGFSDVMLEERFGPIDNERYRDYLRDINRSGTHVLELVNDLLDLSKIEAGKLELTFEAVELNQIVAETVALLQPQANSDRIIIRTSLSRAVPKVVADPRSIRQIILNLVSNAIKFSPANSQVIVSTIYENNGEVALRVRDTGLGMSKLEIEEALKPFHQIHQINDKGGKGTGLGLPLTKALVEANRALFDLESEPGVGTIAHIQFPMQRVLTE